MVGGVLGVAGITGSSIHSVVQGKPDHSKKGGSGSSASTTSEPADVTGNQSQRSWAVALLKAVGINPTKQAVNNVIAWEKAEGGNWNNTAKFNPLNTTLKTKNSSIMAGGSSAGVQSYGSWNEGLNATVNTLRNYPQIVSSFAGSFSHFQSVVSSSSWGTWK